MQSTTITREHAQAQRKTINQSNPILTRMTEEELYRDLIETRALINQMVKETGLK